MDGKKLKIFVATDSNPNPKGLVDSTIWDRNLIDPLRDLGHEVIRFDYDLKPFSIHANPAYPRDREWQDRHRPALEEALLKQVREKQAKPGIDVFLSYFWDAHVTPETIREIGRLGIATVNWFCNGSFQFHMVEKVAPAFDYSLVPEKFRIEDYRRIGANPLYFQEAANPNYYRPIDVEQDLEVTFVGQCYGDRVDYGAALHRAGVPVRMFGPRWVEQAARDASFSRRMKRWRPVQAMRRMIRKAKGRRLIERDPVPAAIANPPVSDEEMLQLYSRSRISLGFSTCGETDQGDERIVQVRLRDMEAPMCGAFYLVERMDELAEFFEYDKEIVGYSSAEELIEKCRYFLKHEPERNRIREAGRKRALADHTWQKRFSELFEKIGLA